MRVKFRLVRNRPKNPKEGVYRGAFTTDNVGEFALLVEASATTPDSYYGDGTRHRGYGETMEAALADLKKEIMRALTEYAPNLGVINAIEVKE
jgi:hypothetical protein